jgi:2-polyprenyl-3-methyl-5-hydroxy-6-metoxy-1,4-benzoquinol methylase
MTSCTRSSSGYAPRGAWRNVEKGSPRGDEEHAAAVAAGERFEFGKNWSRFLALLDEERILKAEQSLRLMLDVQQFNGKRFLDVGSGSGLFSLAARRLGAEVYSIDYDPHSVACTNELKRRYFPNDNHWVITEGSILDQGFISRLGSFDIVYSWGVLHHTGAMWRALERVVQLVEAKGRVCIAIYNDQGRASRHWFTIKRIYNKLPLGAKWCVLWPSFVRLWGPSMLRDLLKGHPLLTWANYSQDYRGMNPWRDVVDWVGGYPFEVAKPEEIFHFFRSRGFQLEKLKTCAGGLGCNEYVFEKRTSDV